MRTKRRTLVCLLSLFFLMTVSSFPGWFHGAHAEVDGQININQASVEELVQLPRVGPKVAERIVEHRTQNGAFQSVDDLKNVQGIGDKVLEQLRPLVCVK